MEYSKSSALEEQSKREKLISVVVPIYNGEKYIESGLNSILSQTYSMIEIILVNDGSTDGTARKCDTAASTYSNVKVIHQENKGTATARNSGLAQACGEYIYFFDIDDAMKENMLEIMVGLIEQYQVDLVVCGYYFKVEEYIKNKVVVTYLEEKKYPFTVYSSFNKLKKDYIDLWDADMFSNVWNKLYRMDAIQKYNISFRDGHVYTEDRVFNRAFLLRCPSMVITDKCLYYYIRERAGSTTERYREDSFIIRNKEFNEFKEHFRTIGIWNEKAREYVCREFIERIVGCIENVFHADKQLSSKEKYLKIKFMIYHKDVREASKYARCHSGKMCLLEIPIKSKWIMGAYIMGDTIYQIRKRKPALFHKLKNKR